MRRMLRMQQSQYRKKSRMNEPMNRSKVYADWFFGNSICKVKTLSESFVCMVPPYC